MFSKTSVAFSALVALLPIWSGSEPALRWSAGPPDEHADHEPRVLGVSNVDRVAAPAPPTAAELAERCTAARARVLAEPALPGAPALQAIRPKIFGYAKAEPVLFVQEPAFDSTADGFTRAHRRSVHEGKYVFDQLKQLSTAFRIRPALGRAVVLREGYLYADRPELAFSLVDRIGAHHLFDAPRIWIQRGERTLYADRKLDGTYQHTDGPEAGKPARLILFDRIGTGDPPPPLHRDLRSLQYRVHFDRLEVEHLTEKHIVARLRYGDVWVPSLLRAEGAELELECEAPPAESERKLEAARALGARSNRALGALRGAMLAQIEEQLPFDEPRTEYGQQDGHLRRKWFEAYKAGQTIFKFQDDLYNVFDLKGRPRPPQVCVDFLFDTFERASGTWFQPVGQKRAKVIGKLDFRTIEDETMRRATALITYAEQNPNHFEIEHLPPNEQIEFWRRERFYRFLVEQADRMPPGAIVLIRGYVPWEKPWMPRIMHYHSFFVYERDPMTGMPLVLVGNPGNPSLRTWRFETLRTPRRSIWHILRPKHDWLESVVVADANNDANQPPPLSVGPG